MSFFGKVKRDLVFATKLRGILKLMKDIQTDSPVTIADEIEASVDQSPNKTALIFEGQSQTYGMLDERANQVAHWALEQGYESGDTIALILENCPDFVAVWFGLSKIGVVTALINTNLEGAGLAHCINIVDSKAIIAAGDQAKRAKVIQSDLVNEIAIWDFDGKSGNDMADALSLASTARPDRRIRSHLRGSDTCLFIYTSGTTGLPKAAKITQMRFRGMGRTAVALCGLNSSDRVYNVLPLYHTTGGGLGMLGALNVGATTVLRRKFSASAFWDDVVDNDATLFVYIGELCRYLLNAEPNPKEKGHQLRAGYGNGLRGEVWMPFVDRFQVPTMREIYGSTEGNVTLLNLDGTVGAIGQMPKWLDKKMGVAFVKFDVVEELPIRDAKGFCIKANVDEVGETLGRIGTIGRETFSGYHEKAATNSKILTDVFEPGDRWFRTGDLMRRDGNGYVYFIDRVGDTFRWKGENVATNEVSDALSKYPGVSLANVYGLPVPHTEGKAGMAAITVDKKFNISGLKDHLARHLPAYAIPLFIRIQPKAETTGTFKFRKVELVKEGFDISEIEDPLWFLNPEDNGYVKLGTAEQDRIKDGGYRF